MFQKLRETHVLSVAAFMFVILAALGWMLVSSMKSEEDGNGNQYTVQALDVQVMDAPSQSQDVVEPIEVLDEEDVDPTIPSNEEIDASFVPIQTSGSGYSLTDTEREAVECAVMAEAGGESVKGQMMVAQCILDGSLRNNFDVQTTIYKYSVVTCAYSMVTDQVKESVSRVFDDGERVTEAKADLWYNPSLVKSEWHEQQQYVITIGSHRFFWMNNDYVPY